MQAGQQQTHHSNHQPTRKPKQRKTLVQGGKTMDNVEHAPPGNDTGNTPHDYLELLLVGLAVIGTALIAAIGLWATFSLLFGDRAGAVTRPDYQALGVCAPDVTKFADGEIQFTVPVDCAPLRWHNATFDLAPFGGRHVLAPQPVVCDVSFTIADGEARGVYFYTDIPGGCDRAALLNDPKGTFIVHLPAGSCGTQQDQWLDGVDQPYAAWVAEATGVCVTPPTVAPPGTVPPPVVNEDVLSAAQAPPLANVDDTSGSGEQVTLSARHAPDLFPAAAPSVAVLGAYAERTLPATGRGPLGAVVGLLVLLLGALLALAGWVIRKDGRS